MHQVHDPQQRLNLGMSMFERLVENSNLPVHQMLVQRRMRPCIAELIRSTLYPSLVDGACVQNYPDVSGGCLPGVGLISQVNVSFWL